MNLSRLAIFLLSALFTLATLAQTTEQEPETTPAYIADNLFVYLHSGPGKQYRIVGTIEAGEAIKLTGKQENGFVELITPKNKHAWLEQEYIQTNPGLRFVLAELNSQLSEQQSLLANSEQKSLQQQQQITQLTSTDKQQKQHINQLEQQLAELKKQLKDQDFELKKRWFFNGAIVLGIGLLFGLILPKLFTRRRNSLESWN